LVRRADRLLIVFFKVITMRLLLLPPIISLMLAMLMAILHLNAPIIELIPRPVNWAGLLLIGAGLVMAQWHARLFRRIGTNIDTFGEPGKLTMEGLFRRTRNPMYLGMLVFLIGLAGVLGTVSALAGPVVFFVMAHFYYIPLEERAMTLKFGSAYADYQRDVPRWL
jgi:protein-S-isoprenylcysteine O-methyltransferase Ste14